jgi:hypothetical protein
MSPWTRSEVDKIVAFMPKRYDLVFNPIEQQGNLIPAGLILDADSELYKRAEYRLHPATDDQPYFGFLRKTLRQLDYRESPYLDWGTADLQNKQLKGPIPMDLIHLIVVGLIALVFAFVSILIPLRFSEAGRVAWDGKAVTLLYFSALGAGFIIFELTLIQIFIKLIGYPVYAYSTVVFAYKNKLIMCCVCDALHVAKPRRCNCNGRLTGRQPIESLVHIIRIINVFAINQVGPASVFMNSAAYAQFSRSQLLDVLVSIQFNKHVPSIGGRPSLNKIQSIAFSIQIGYMIGTFENARRRQR